MTYADDFKNNTADFLQDHLVTMNIPDDYNPGEARPSFKIEETQFLDRKTRQLKTRYVISPYDPVRDAGIDPSQVIRAYWLPYQPDSYHHIALGNDADFVFTADFSGCTFAFH